MDRRVVEKDLVFVFHLYGCAMQECWEPLKAVKLFKEMKKKGIKVVWLTFNTILKFLCENMRCLEKPREILTLFDRMIERESQTTDGYVCDAYE
nr:pentatricopeptide repeat-containing protein At1g80550, mitochondrial-like [Ipomoea batatas]